MLIYAEIPNFNGGTTLKVELIGCQFGGNRGIDGKSGESGIREKTKPSITEVTISRETDKYSPLFYQETLAASARKITIYFSDPKKEKLVLTVILTDAMLASYSRKSSGGQTVEWISITFARITRKHDVDYSEPLQYRLGFDLEAE